MMTYSQSGERFEFLWNSNEVQTVCEAACVLMRL